MIRGWWVRRTGGREPVVYVADVQRLKNDATDLLEACRKAEAHHQGPADSIGDMLSAAITKATGGQS